VIERYHRCIKCGVRYIYQESGHSMRENNDPNWCPGCRIVVDVALATIPVKLIGKYRATKDAGRFSRVTLPMCLEWEQRRWAEPAEGWFPKSRQVFVGLMNLETGETQDSRVVVGYDNYRGIRFRVTTWREVPPTPKNEEYSIEILMEWDVEKGAFTGDTWT
jgi:hypothetical protein